MLPLDSQCYRCRHWVKGTLICLAFPPPAGIPDAIIFGEQGVSADHRQPFAGDHGLRWEPKAPGVKHPLEETK